MFNLGLLLGQTGRKEEAETWYRKAAEGGDPRAMLNLVSCSRRLAARKKPRPGTEGRRRWR